MIRTLIPFGDRIGNRSHAEAQRTRRRHKESQNARPPCGLCPKLQIVNCRTLFCILQIAFCDLQFATLPLRSLRLRVRLSMKLAFSSNAYLRFSIEGTIARIASLGYTGIELLADVPH